jgi:hypothetical protein
VVLFAAEDIGETATGADLLEKEFLTSHWSRAFYCGVSLAIVPFSKL